MAHASQRPDHTIDWDEIESRHRPVMLVSRPAYEGWILTLFGAVLLGLIALIGWGGYLLSIVKTELRQLKATVEHSTQGHPSEEAMSRRTPRQEEPMLPPRPPSESVNQGTSQRGVEREPPVWHGGDRLQPRPPPPSPAATVGETGPRIYVHIRSSVQLQAAQSITAQFKEKGYAFPKAEIVVEKGPAQTQVRYFRNADAREAAQLAALLT